MQERDFDKIKVKNNICINVFGYGNKLVFPICVSDKKFKNSMDLLLLIKLSLINEIQSVNNYGFHLSQF